MAQDLPPAGGYEPVQYKRNLPARGFRPAYYLLAVGVIMTYGLYKYGKGVREHKYEIPFDVKETSAMIEYSSISSVRLTTAETNSELAREKMWSRIYLTPLLQAETDRDQVRRYWADQGREQELLGRTTKPYHSDRFVRPTYGVTPGIISE
ncbi:MAG: hypothetical protein Q9216_001175 [Gyalolechia sp. 2 TL-2023]